MPGTYHPSGSVNLSTAPISFSAPAAIHHKIASVNAIGITTASPFRNNLPKAFMVSCYFPSIDLVIMRINRVNTNRGGVYIHEKPTAYCRSHPGQ